MFARKALLAAALQLLLAGLAAGLTWMTGRLDLGGLLAGASLPLSLIVAFHALQSANHQEPEAPRRNAALILSLVALAMASGFGMALGAQMPFRYLPHRLPAI